MSLAAALARDGMRPASCLPTIKCSNCAEEIEIAEMGDHVCGAPAPAPVPSPPFARSHTPHMSNPFTLRRFNTGDQPPMPMSPPQADSPPQDRVRAVPLHSTRKSRTSLPKINPEAANRPYLAPRKGTMDSPLSPATSNPSDTNSSSKFPFARSLTTPVPRLYDPRPPSPELSANLDCAFPPFPGPASSGRRPSTPSNGRKTPNTGDRAPSRGGSRLDRVLTASPEQVNMAPKSPRLNGGETVLQKMQTLQAGPFNSSRRGSDDPDHGTMPSLSHQANVVPERLSPTMNTRYDPMEGELIRGTTPPSSANMPIAEAQPSIFLDRLSAEPDSLPLHNETADNSHFAERSNTFPSREGPKESKKEGSPSQMVSKTRSEPGLHSTPVNASPSSIPTYQLPPRKDSMSGTRIDFRIQDAPPVPKAIQEYRQEGIHTPSDSGSSMASMTNSTSNSHVSSTSPAGSVASSFETFSPLSYDAPRYRVEDKMGAAALNVKNSMQPGLRAEQPSQRSPSKKYNRPPKARDQDSPVEVVPLTPLESPMDPMLQQMQMKVVPLASQVERPPLNRTRTAPGPVPRADASVMPNLPDPSAAMQSNNFNRSASPIRRSRSTSVAGARTAPGSQGTNPQTRKPSTRRATNAKAPCRGCGQVIEGKSVKAADGRMTGRWHRACFVCRTCKEPFTTADFYVINNEPYCDHHYHEKNGSLCYGCNRGIEGQYLEATSSTRYGIVEKKFHPRCFTCTTCRVVLSHDYFEITSRVYCERHALAAMRAQARLGPGALYPPDGRGLMAERRTTRLINPMIPA